MIFLIPLVVLILLLFAVVGSSVRIIRPYQRGLVERVGRYHATVEPGLRFLTPFIDRMVRVDMRESVVDVPVQEVITSDNVVVKVYAVVYYEATDPQRLVYNVSDFLSAVTKLAQTNLRNVIGDMQLDEALTSSLTINTRLREILDDATDKWGARVVRVEIQRIDPPPDVVTAMHHQMQAERNRRALVTEALGDREAAITRAEGEKEAAVLAAQGQADATRAVAEAERFRQETVAQGEADAIRSVFQAIHDGGPTADVLAIKYFEALQVMAAGSATKIFLPSGPDGLSATLAGLAEIVRSGSETPALPNGVGEAVPVARRPANR
jgi:regulator of protease activity HflC (stomatin/prohibitin superfamily)